MTDEPLIMIDAMYPTKEQELPVPLISKTSPISPAFLAPPPPPQKRYNSPILSAVSSISTLSTINSPIPSVADFTTLSESQKMIQKQFEEIQVLRHDLTALNQKYIRQIEHSDSAEQAKHQVESEIEDLSRRLFEQANEMVSHEKKARHIAEKKQRLLERKLESLAEDLKNERAQLNELRLKFEQEKAAEREKNPILKYIHPLDKSYSLEEEETETETEDDDEDDENSDKEINTHGANTNANNDDNNKPKQQPLQQPLKQQIHHHHHHQQHHQQLRTLDQKWLKLFQDFLIAAQSHSLESLHRLPFLKLCMELDIEPCLKFGNTTKPKNHHLSVKRVLEAVMHHPCYIEPLTDDKKRLSQATIKKKKTNTILSSSSSSPPDNNNRRASFAFGTFRFRSFTSHDDCYGCSSSLKNSSGTVYRFKLKEQDTEWFYIDKTCRDQLVAVCDFYVFIRHVKSGLQSQRNCQSLFQECLWLRLCMFWARSGVSL